MSFIPDDSLFSHSERVNGKVVIITGAAKGIGKETALRFAQYGAKVVVADVDVVNGKNVVAEIKSKQGTASFIKCDVTNWDDQVAMFEFAIKEYADVDIVVPNAGVGEQGGRLTFDKDGKPLRPSLTSVKVNLTGSLYTVQLALHYLYLKPDTPSTFKSLILIGSMASWQAIPGAPLYTGSKHAILGVMRSLATTASLLPTPLRLGCIHPFFADTTILSLPTKLALAGIPFTTTERVAGAIFYAATDPDESSNHGSWLLADDGQVFLVPNEAFKFGVYAMIDKRVNGLQAAVVGIRAWFAFFRGVTRDLAKPTLTTGFGAAIMVLAWKYRSTLTALVGYPIP